MDDFDHSVKISEHDWDAFSQECDECDLLPPALARQDDSSMSDSDDGLHSISLVAEDPIDGLEERGGLPVERYLCACRIPSPMDVLSCSEEDTHLESINVFLERLKSAERAGSIPAEAEPKPTWRENSTFEDHTEESANLTQLPQEKSRANCSALSFIVTGNEHNVNGTALARKEDKDTDRAGKSIETRLEEDEASGSVEPMAALFVRDEDWMDEDWAQEKDGCLFKDKLRKPLPSWSMSSIDEGEVSAEHTEKESQPSGLKDMAHTGHRAGEGDMIIQSSRKETTSLHRQQVELQTAQKVLTCHGMAAGTANHGDKSASVRGKHRSFSIDYGHGDSRGCESRSVKRRRKCFGSSRDPLIAGHSFSGRSGRTARDKKVEEFKPAAVGQAEVVSGHDHTAHSCEGRSEHKRLSEYQMTPSFGTVPRSSEPLAEKESGVDSCTAEHNHDFKESDARPEECSGESIPDFVNQQQQALGYDFQNHSQQIYISENNTETNKLTPCESSPENLQSCGVISQHDRFSPKSYCLFVPESKNISGQYPPKIPNRFHIPEQSSQDQMLLENEPAFWVNASQGKKTDNETSNASLTIFSSAESPQSTQQCVSHVSDSEDSEKQNIPDHEHQAARAQLLQTYCQERNRNSNNHLVISASKEFIQMPNISCPPEPAELSQFLNKTGGQGPSLCKALDLMNVPCPKSEEVKNTPEYEGAENTNDIPINISNNETTEKFTTDVTHKATISASKNHELSARNSGKTLPEVIEKQITAQSDPVPEPSVSDLDIAAVGVSHVSSDGNGSSVTSAALPDGSDYNGGTEANNWPPEKREHSLQSSNMEGVKKSQKVLMDVSLENRVEAGFEPELESALSVNTAGVLTFEDTAVSCAEHNLSFHLESTDSPKPLETNKPNKPLEISEPSKPTETVHAVHSMSEFWKEMEKLTINDILYLRSVNNVQRGLPGNSAVMDTSDPNDSGYSSHLEDPKLDRSSFDVSSISGCVEQGSLSHSASGKWESKDTKMQGQRSLGSSNSKGVLWESKVYADGAQMDTVSNDTPMLCSQDSVSPPFISYEAQAGFRKMHKNISVQNLRALEAESLGNRLRSVPRASITAKEEELQESSSTSQKPEEKCGSTPQETSSDTKTLSSSLGNEVTVGYKASLWKIFEHFFGAGDAGADQPHLEVPEGGGGSVPEMYDYFFSEFEMGNFFLPSIWETRSGQSEPVPLTSCSGSAIRNLQFPEAYDYFFPDSSSSEPEDEEDSDDDLAPVRLVTRFDKSTTEALGSVTGPDAYEHFFSDYDCRERLFWRNPFSLRRTLFARKASSGERQTSCMLVAAKQQRSVIAATHTDSPTSFQGAVSPQTPLYCTEEWAFMELAEQQRRSADLQTAIAVPNAPLSSITQSDMCLMSIAFASWVLTTACPQDADTWKAALLANISALSAIRYLRKCVREPEKE